jgi:hypothetical protein
MVKDGVIEDNCYVVYVATSDTFGSLTFEVLNRVYRQAGATVYGGFNNTQGYWECRCDFAANGAVSLVRFFDSARSRLQIQGTVSAPCTLAKYVSGDADRVDTASCTATLSGGASAQCTAAQAQTCSTDRSQSTNATLVVSKIRYCDAQPAAATDAVMMTLNCAASPGPLINAVYPAHTD